MEQSVRRLKPAATMSYWVIGLLGKFYKMMHSAKRKASK
jgi:hypothetical protein